MQDVFTASQPTDEWAFQFAEAALTEFSADMGVTELSEPGHLRAIRAIVSPIDPHAQETAAERAIALCEAGHYEDAARLTSILIACQPENSRYTHLAGLCQQHLGHIDAALTLYGASMLGQQPCAATCLRIGECHLQKGEIDQAVTAFDASIEMAAQEESGHLIHQLAVRKRELALGRRVGA